MCVCMYGWLSSEIVNDLKCVQYTVSIATHLLTPSPFVSPLVDAGPLCDPCSRPWKTLTAASAVTGAHVWRGCTPGPDECVPA